MADFARTRVTHEYATNSDYNKSLTEQYEETGTPEYIIRASFSATTSGVTFDLSPWTTIEWLLVRNKDTTNFVWADYYEQIGSQDAGATGYAFADANPDTITDGDTNGTFVTNGAAKGNWVRVTGSENSGENDSTFLIYSTTTDVITLATGEALTANAADTTASLSFERYNREKIAASGWQRISLPVIAGDLVLTADTAACEVEILGVASA